MIDELKPLIYNFKCRICYENITNIKKYCNCKNNLLYHDKCFNTWLKFNPKINSCEICCQKLNLKYLYSKYDIIKYLFILIFIFSFCIYIEISLIKNNDFLKNNKNNIIFITFIGFFFLIRIFYYMFFICVKKNKYILPLTNSQYY